MRTNPCTSRALSLALGLLLAACGADRPAALRAGTPASSPRHVHREFVVARSIPARPGFSRESQLAGDAVHVYTFQLEQDRFVDLEVDQRGLDVAARLYGPDGSLVTAVDSYSPDGTRGVEPVPMVSRTAGTYRLEIRASDPQAHAGRYAVQVRCVREATPRDRDRVAAERAFASAQALRAAGGGPSLRRAVTAHRTAIDRFLALGDRRRAVDALLSLGQMHQDVAEPAAARSAFQQAAGLARKPDHGRERAAALVGLGVAEVALGETDSAVRSYREALTIAQALGDRRTEADALSNLARAYTVPGKTEKALDLYGQALALRRQLGQSEGTCLVGMGRAYALMGDPQRAIDTFSRGLPFLQAGGQRREAAGVLDDYGRALVRMGRTQEGIATIERSLRLQRQLENRAGEAVALSDLGAVYAGLGRKKAALEFYGLALDVFHQRGERLRETITLAIRARLQEETGDLRGAAESYSQVLRLSQAHYRSGEAAALLGLARVRKGLGDLAGARQLAENALERIEALRVETESPELRASFLATKQEYYELYVDLLMALHRREPAAGHDARAFEASELARARSLLDLLAQTRADLRRGIDPRLLAREAELGYQVNAAERRRLSLAESGAPRARLEGAERDLRELLAQSEELRDRIRRTSPRYAALSQARPASLHAIQVALAPDTLLLEYALGRERSYLWAVTSTSVTSAVLPPRALVEKAARRALAVLANGDGASALLQSDLPLAEASRLLLEPVAGGLRKRLLIVGDGALHALPFAALENPGPRGEPTVPLVAEHEVLHLPSASTLIALRSEPAASHLVTPLAFRKIAVLADPVFGPTDPRVSRASTVPASLRGPERNRFSPLPFSRREAEAILALVPAGRRLAALGFEASRQTALSGRLEPYGIVHFATHGVLDDRYPELSGIALSMVDRQGRPVDGWLRVHDIYRLSLPADLVVLSACDTALGREVPGEGLIGLTRAFFYAGARRVLVSLWPVEDEATAELMQRFYREMLRGDQPPAAALQVAQNSLRNEPRWQAPYYWAGFTLQGDWR